LYIINYHLKEMCKIKKKGIYYDLIKI